MKHTLVLFALLTAVTTHAQPVLQRGDVIAQIGSCTPLPEDPCAPDELVIADSFGIPRSSVSLPGLPKFFEPYGLFFIDPNRAIYSTYKDGRYGVFEWRADLGGSTVNPLLEPGAYEMGRLRHGDLLTAIYTAGKPAFARFTLAGELRGIYGIPDAPQIEYFWGSTYAAVARMELLADQCTVLWTPSTGARVAVHTFDICSGTAKALFLDPTPQFESDIRLIGSIRALPNGDVLIAT